MYRTHTCGDLDISHVGKRVKLSGWVQKIRDKGFFIWVDIRDRYGITQLIFDQRRTEESLINRVKEISREFVIQVEGEVIERESKNKDIPTGEVELLVSDLEILNSSDLPPFTIEDDTDGGESLRMKYRYLDIRRNIIKNNIIFRHELSQSVRNFLSKEKFLEIETPFLIKSTPEGARDFIVPSRVNRGQFYALPQSPQTFKQLLMIGGMDKYFQIVRCFRDEDLRADRQPEFTQIDCEMSFVHRDDILDIFERMVKHLFKELKGIDMPDFPRMDYEEAFNSYGTDKPDIRFDMKLSDLTEIVKNRGFEVFDSAEFIGAIVVPDCGHYSRKQIDELTDWVKRPQIGASGLFWLKRDKDDDLKSSMGKFFSADDMLRWLDILKAKPGDLVLLMCGEKNQTIRALGELRLEMGKRLDLRDPNKFAPLWVLNFPLFEWDQEASRYNSIHHPFTSPLKGDISLLESDPSNVKADSYDLVLNGNEIGGGSVRIHDLNTQDLVFKCLGLTDQQIREKFGFFMESFKYGVPPHGGIAFGLDRLVSVMCGKENIRDFIAFPKNNSARDIMLDAPSVVDSDQLEELGIKTQ
ncbi:aspartate--tRNA ligase [Ichthyobacterium seriolicida]|uniref:Aspartate--tRNA ligase n=1 Tax=Ichthyobacterium seriolicida TaxID=242600 RepID=A0A1J1E496_9FLAO|nr:aspartate--tRNA ligase [Ichthyobacterium seriolicida]BAV94142.1 aspartyl-tRNA synthetase [Ichthyobacterium seriolicida]